MENKNKVNNINDWHNLADGNEIEQMLYLAIYKLWSNGDTINDIIKDIQEKRKSIKDYE